MLKQVYRSALSALALCAVMGVKHQLSDLVAALGRCVGPGLGMLRRASQRWRVAAYAGEGGPADAFTVRSAIARTATLAAGSECGRRRHRESCASERQYQAADRQRARRGDHLAWPWHSSECRPSHPKSHWRLSAGANRLSRIPAPIVVRSFAACEASREVAFRPPKRLCTMMTGPVTACFGVARHRCHGGRCVFGCSQLRLPSTTIGPGRRPQSTNGLADEASNPPRF